MVKKLLIFVLGTTILQLVTYVLLLQIGILISNFYGNPHKSISFGISVNISIIVFFLVALIGNLFTTLINKKAVYNSALLITSLLLIGYHFNLYTHWPNRALFIMVISSVSMLSKLLYDKWLGRLTTGWLSKK
jgi:uncharacterized membrane protein